MELTPLTLSGIVESVAPINTQKTDHREEDPDTDPGGSLDLERIETLYVRPAITALKEKQGENG